MAKRAPRRVKKEYVPKEKSATAKLSAAEKAAKLESAKATIFDQRRKLLQLGPESEILQLGFAVLEYREQVLGSVLSLVIACRDHLLQEKRGQPDYDQFKAETDDSQMLPEVVRKLAPYVDLDGILAAAIEQVKLPSILADTQIPPFMGEAVRDEIIAELEVALGLNRVH